MLNLDKLEAETYAGLVEKQRRFFQSKKTKEMSFRLQALQKLKQSIKEYESEILLALKQDLNKSEFEAYTSEVGFVLKELSDTIKHLKAWAKPRKVKTPITHIGSSGSIHYEPYGVSLIIAPWNYPFQLAIAPLIGAVAAGNCVLLKPSELAPETSAILSKLIHNTFLEEFVTVVEGGVETSNALLKEKYDYIFFTGSVPVGKIVYESAAKHLTPVTLELGGKSPCIVHEDANIKLATKRIAWGKFFNAGQTCVAPDYLYVHSSIKEEFLLQLQQAVKELYGENALENENFTRIVSERHFERLTVFLKERQIAFGGNHHRQNLTIEPTILTDVTWNDEVMQEEIFGPILPVMEFTSLVGILQDINSRAKPLALYIFSENKAVQKQVVNAVSFGGGCINDTVYHFTNPNLPFGGVGSSGIGAYHGKGSFELFSHQKSVLTQTTLFDIPLRYPNVKDGLKKIKMFLR
jgi:aldehyde dehydrogenase (NAD+)